MQYVDIKGLAFAIDTSEWINREDAQQCSELIARGLAELDYETLLEAHEIMLDEFRYEAILNGYVKNESVEKVLWLAIECGTAILSTYWKQPDKGHNYNIFALRKLPNDRKTL